MSIFKRRSKRISELGLTSYLRKQEEEEKKMREREERKRREEEARKERIARYESEEEEYRALAKKKRAERTASRIKPKKTTKVFGVKIKKKGQSKKLSRTSRIRLI